MASTSTAASPSPTLPVTPEEAKTGLEMQVLGNIISALAYSAVVILFSLCFWALRKPSKLHSHWTRPLLYVYMTYMFAMSTTAFIQETIYTTKVIKNDIFPTGPDLVDYLTSLGEPLPLPFTIWGADGFMGISPLRHLVLTIVLGLLGLTSLGDISFELPEFNAHCPCMTAIGIAFFAVAGIFQTKQGNAILPFVPDSLALPFQNSSQSAISSFVMFCTTFVNLTLTSLIFFRLLYYQRFISKTLGAAHASTYTRVITMCIESCALIVVISTTNIVMIITNNVGYLIPFMLLPHICVISPLLIVYRVAVGRSANTRRPPADLTLGHHSDERVGPFSSIRFNQPESTTANGEDSLSSDGSTANPAIPLTSMSSAGAKDDWKE
ncbi:hypothetical protein CVT26_003339 [Gymnopilus dilepis]|uniref:Uncharacterized protein n=1 Tax=Gymnopilus dilepis TaxID=231916 RepID=A0A409W2S9_9AGAR|nr:hypothetical protein CVT26_003339 [Gymnopilus dilepis]